MGKRLTWTREDENGLRRLHRKGKSYQYIAKELGRSYSSVVSKANDLGLHRYVDRFEWNDETNEKFSQLIAEGYSFSRISLELGCTWPQVRYHADGLGIRIYAERHAWTKEDDDYILANWQNLSQKEIAEHLGVRFRTYQRHELSMGLFRQRSKRRPWTSAEIQILKDNMTKRVDQLAELTGHTPGSTYAKVYQLRVQDKNNERDA